MSRLRLLLAIFAAGVLLSAKASAQDRFQNLYEFSGETSPKGTSSLLQAADGCIYGTTAYGGVHNGGTLFRLMPDGSFRVIHSFAPVWHGGWNVGPVLHLQASDGSVYVSDVSTVFKVTGDLVTVLTTEVDPGVLLESNNELYGIGDATGFGQSFFKVAEDGAVAVLHAFESDSPEGTCPSTLLHASDGNFYGTTQCGGTGNRGTLFSLTSAGAVTVVHVFNDDAVLSVNSLVEGPGGTFFGTGADSYQYQPLRVLFRMAPDGSVTRIGTLSYGDAFLLNFDGNAFHGVSSTGGFGRASVFSLTPGGELTTLAWFDGYFNQPSSADPKVTFVIQGRDGFYYASQRFVNFVDQDKVLRLGANGANTVIHAFTHNPAGSSPTAALVEASDGNFYGTTAGGGTQNAGTLFRMTRWGRLEVLHEFNGSDGKYPSSLIQATDGNLYGVTYNGGAFGAGTIFRFSLTTGVFELLHSFKSEVDGYGPTRLLQATDGLLYGIAISSGGQGYTGTIFRLESSGTVSVLHRFRRADADLADPGPTALLQASDGALYGTTQGAYAHKTGSVFKLLLDGTFTRLYTFDRDSGGRPGTLVELSLIHI